MNGTGHILQPNQVIILVHLTPLSKDVIEHDEKRTYLTFGAYEALRMI